MMKMKLSSLVLPALALLLAAWWFLQDRPLAPDGEAGPDASVPVATPTVAPAPVARPVGQVPGYTAPPIESLTPAEVAQLHRAEVERSAKSEPPKTFVGIDGKTHAFEYNSSAKSSAKEEAREVRRALLMRQLMADPQRFARENKLTLKEVQWIVDGDSDFPDRLLD
ncbi:MAG: hypothetical protein A3E01_20065 [Gammaproteobacteria bacterium RIFCSPHIGHO2_12_FULL_63_22]|nr:MAG: hypothetical protein A3E01_20065 [Gammaproteobacteria bacterium RIFCSPHIGHO2_12_FULL_63_22]